MAITASFLYPLVAFNREVVSYLLFEEFLAKFLYYPFWKVLVIQDRALQFIRFSAILFLAHHILVFDEARGYFPYARGTMVFCQSHPISQKLQRAIAIYADMKEKLSEFCNLTRIQLLPY